MLKNKKIICFVLSLLAVSCSDKQNHTVTANIDNLGNDTIYVRLSDIDGRSTVLDTILISKNNRFSFDVSLKAPAKCEIVTQKGKLDTKTIRGVVDRGTMALELYMFPNEKYKIKGVYVDNSIKYNIEGSELNSIMAELRNKYLDIYRYIDMESEYFRDGRTKEERDSVYMIGEDIKMQLLSEQKSFILNNSDNQLSGLFLSELNIKDFDECYNIVSDSVKNGVFSSLISRKKYTSDLVYNNQKLAIGTVAPNFKINDGDGKTINLSDYKGKYVFLYFWGSW